MKNTTRILLNGFVSHIALINNVEDATKQFTVDPVVEQNLEEVIQQSSEFLQSVSIVPVSAQSGDKVGIGVSRTIAGRTNTAAGNRRKATSAADSSDLGRYFCYQTNFDYGIRYSLLDAWAHRPEFQTLIRDAIAKQQGRDRIMIGWNGLTAAIETDREAFPLLQDVNEGWLHKIRTHAPDHVIDDGDLTDDPDKAIYVADGVMSPEPNADVDYNTLDLLVTDATNELIDEIHQEDPDLVVIVGRRLVQDKYFNIQKETGNTATEIEATDRILRSTKQIGGLPAVRVPFFPANALLVTTLENLAIYVQEGTRRRELKDESDLDQISNFESVNEAYVVEDYRKTAFVENIVMGKRPAA